MAIWHAEEKEVAHEDASSIGVMAVDNLPCELPRDASESFGKDMLKHVIPALLMEMKKVCLKGNGCSGGSLTADFSYLQDYVDQAQMSKKALYILTRVLPTHPSSIQNGRVVRVLNLMLNHSAICIKGDWDFPRP